MKKAVWGALSLLLLFLLILTGFEREAIYKGILDSRMALLAFEIQHPFVTPLLFILSYAIALTLSLPIGIYLTLLSGFLFPQPGAFFYALMGATLGSIGLFSLIRFAIIQVDFGQHSQRFQHFQEKFIPDSAFYLLSLRLVPLSPYWLINLASAVMNVPFWTFAWTTVLGIAPETFVISQLGVTLGTFLDTEHGQIVKPTLPLETKIALGVLALLALIPLIYRHWRKSN